MYKYGPGKELFGVENNGKGHLALTPISKAGEAGRELRDAATLECNPADMSPKESALFRRWNHA